MVCYEDGGVRYLNMFPFLSMKRKRKRSRQKVTNEDSRHRGGTRIAGRGPAAVMRDEV